MIAYSAMIFVYRALCLTILCFVLFAALGTNVGSGRRRRDGMKQGNLGEMPYLLSLGQLYML
ncbi:hypothetical protein BDR03DRAFT_963453 [Suillus americanus]|nr:hypothetical protein BDR03DRAFT_963453 [Suillus americanus]